jgi:hypothetical protein
MESDYKSHQDRIELIKLTILSISMRYPTGSSAAGGFA